MRMYKKVYNEVPNFMYGNGTYTYVEAHVLFYKTWLILLFTDASFEKLFEKYCFERVFCTKKNCIKRERDLYSLIFERPLFYFHKTWWMILKKRCEIYLLKNCFGSNLEKSFLLKQKLYKERRKGLILSNIREAPHRFENQLIN